MRTYLKKLANRGIYRIRGWQHPDRLRALGLDIGKGVFIGPQTMIDQSHLHLISIGDGTAISSGVHVLAHDASTKMHLGYTRIGLVQIGKMVFIGAGAIVMLGVTVGDGAVIGAGAVVTKDVEAGMVVVGNPARPICTVSDFLNRRQIELETAPRWKADGWVTSRGLTVENAQLMRHALNGCIGFVE